MSVKYKRLRKERNEERRRGAAISELVDVNTLITEIASNAPFMLYIETLQSVAVIQFQRGYTDTHGGL